MLKKIQKLSLFIVATLAGISGSALATVLQLPPENAITVGYYNSFGVFSLDLNKQCAAAGDPRCLPSGPYPIASSPGQIADQAIILTSADGMSNFTSPFSTGTAVDEVFLTPTGQQSGSFSMAGKDTLNFGTGDLLDRWDIGISLLNGYLKGHSLVFLFDNNQSESASNALDLAIWGQARIVDGSGNTINNLCFEVSTGTGGCSGDAPNNNFVTIPNEFCVDKSTGASYAPTGNGANACKDATNHPAGGYLVSDNKSTSSAELAVFNKDLDSAIRDLANQNYFLSVHIAYQGNDAGAEQLWICSECDLYKKNQIPEPGTLVLLCSALFGLAVLRHRKVH